MAANHCRHVNIKRNTMNNYKLNILLLIILLPFVSEAQWVEILNYKDQPSGGRVKNLSFLDDSVGVFSHKGIHLLKTIDFGQSWDTVFTNTNGVWRVQFINDSIGFITLLSPNPYNFYKTTDQGETWTGIDSSPKIDFVHTSYFVNETLGFVITWSSQQNKWLVYKTVDGGVLWQPIAAPFNGSIVEAMAFFDEEVGFAAGCGSCGHIVTKNGGNTWNQMPFAGNYFFSFPDSTTGYTGGNDYIWRTDDKGETWQVVNDYDPILCLDCPSRDTCYGGRLYGVHKTVDGGQTWEYTYLKGNTFSSISCPSNDTCYLASIVDSRLYRTFNGGEGGFISSTDEAEDTKDLKVGFFPNPVSTVLRWASHQSYPVEQVELLSSDGRIISSATGKSGSLDVWQIPSGIYTARCIFSDGLMEHHVIVKH